MKVGFILECGVDGPDHKIWEYLPPLVVPGVIPVVRTLTNKDNMIAQCGITAKILMQSGCEHIIITWDVLPRWQVSVKSSETKPWCKVDCDKIWTQIDASGVPRANVDLACFDKELETLLLHDHTAIERVLRGFTTHPVSVSKIKSPEKVQRPKEHLEQVFSDNRCRTYAPYSDAIQIVKQADLKKLEKNLVLSRIKSKLLLKMPPTT